MRTPLGCVEPYRTNSAGRVLANDMQNNSCGIQQKLGATRAMQAGFCSIVDAWRSRLRSQIHTLPRRHYA
jgi:hypothetical protein